MPSLPEIISTADNEWHERDTHTGWEYELYNSDVNLSWAKRKKILVDTINCIFDFSFLDIQLTNICSNIEISIHPSQFTVTQQMLLSNGSKSRSFAAIIYYRLKHIFVGMSSLCTWCAFCSAPRSWGRNTLYPWSRRPASWGSWSCCSCLRRGRSRCGTLHLHLVHIWTISYV